MNKLKYLKKRIKSLRTEQKYAYDEMQKNNLLQLCYACGFGKGYIIGTDLLNQVTNCDTGIFALCSHRLGLNEQHISDIFDLFMCPKSPLLGEVAFAFIGSSGGLNIKDLMDDHDLKIDKRIANYNDNLPQNKKINLSELVITTTSKKVLLDFINKHHNRKIIIVSTYHSSDKLSYIENITTLYCDEAHELATNFNDSNKKNENGRDSFIQNYLKINSKRKFFFTATPKDCSGDSLNTYLMNNESLFGKRIGLNHIDSIDKGYILGTRIYLAFPEFFDENFNNDFGSIINKANFILKIFNYHKEWLRTTSSFPNKIAPKVLIRCSSVEKDLWPIFNQLKLICGNIKIFASASKDENNETIKNNYIYQNGESLQFCKNNKTFTKRFKYVDRKDYIESIQNLSDLEESITLHHDTISEGINVPGFTCFVPFSDTLIDFIKLYQNVGRVIRLNKEDKKLFLEGKLKVNEPGWIKPEAQIIIPYWSNITNTAAQIMVDTIIKLETEINAKTSIEIPYCSNLATGYGIQPEKTARKRVDDSKLTIDKLLFLEREKIRRYSLNSKIENLTKIKDILNKFDTVNE